MQVNYLTFKKESFTCPKCGWTGKGSELSKGDLSEKDFIQDLDCPDCYEHIGFWQAPLKGEAPPSINGDITLYNLDTEAEKRDIHLKFEGDILALDGYDRGAITKELTGDYDYEYRITVKVSALPPLYNRFGLQTGQRQALLEAVAAEIAGSNCYTLFLKMLRAAGVTFDTWSA